MSLNCDALMAAISPRLEGESADYDALLMAVMGEFGCVVGTLHRLDADAQLLKLSAQRGLPAALFEKVAVIPVGKGMAGLAAQRREAVQVCNLMTDDSGVAKPSAKLTEMAGSITVPLLAGDQLHGTLGIARPDEHEFDDAQTLCLMQIGERIARQFAATH